MPSLRPFGFRLSLVCLMLLAISLLCLIFVLVGCAKKQPGSNSIKATSRNAVAAKLQTPSDEECRKFAESLRDALLKNDIAKVNQLIDWNSLIERGIGDLIDSQDDRAKYLTGFLEKNNLKTGLMAQICKPIQEGGSYHLNRIYDRDGDKRALFRLLNNDGVTYHDYVLVRQENGTVQAVDILTYTSGDMLSKTLRRIYLTFGAQESKSFLERLTGSENAYAKSAPQVIKMKAALQSKNYRDVMDEYYKLPSEVQKEN